VAGSRYSQSVDLDNWNSSHSLAVLSVPPGSRVLDLGTADGSVARALKQRGCTVWGIEQDQQAAEAASQVCDRVIVANLEAKEAFEPLGSETFDVVLALDVLEHLRDPTPVLKCAASYLSPGGIAVVSIPNVTHGALRLSLLEGRFNYTEQGLLDRTHLRFFDRHAAEQLITEAGLTISQHLRVRRELEETEIAVNKDHLPIELLRNLASDPDATTYQFVFVAGRTNLSAEPHSGGMLSERLLTENERVRAQFKELETYTRNLEADLAARLDAQPERDELRQELARRIQEAHEMHRDLRHSRADVVVKDAFISDLRQQLSERDQLAAQHKRLSAKYKQLAARRDQLAEERRRLLARQEALETNLRALRIYVNSAGFRIVENMVRRLGRFPTLFRTIRTIARKVVGRSAAAE
jgi:2-polyprenyl-3-methyl-5-hydroxy-6-metoxy-1,4-benzoquinol methylase